MYRLERSQSFKRNLDCLFETYEKVISPDIFGKTVYAFWEFIKDICIHIETSSYNVNGYSYDDMVLMNNPY